MEKEGITISPVFREVVVNTTKPEAEFILRVTNNTEETASFALSVVDFGSLDESGGVAFLGLNKSDIEGKYSLASWLRLSNEEILVEAGKKVEVKITVENRESLSPGGHYGAVLLTAMGDEKAGQDKVNLRQAYSSLVYVKKEGGEIYDLKLNRITWQKNIFLKNDKVELRWENKGNVHVVPRGKIVVYDWWGREVKTGIINQESALVLPESFRKQNVPLRKMVKILLPGKYRMETAYRYDGKDNFDREKSEFFYVGWWWLPVVLGIALIVWKFRKK